MQFVPLSRSLCHLPFDMSYLIAWIAPCLKGDVYWEGERKLCAAMYKRGCVPRRAPLRQDNKQDLESQQQQQQLGGLHEDEGGVQQHWEGFTLEDAIAVHESKSFDYRVSIRSAHL